jgi:hypothetical protein
MVNLWTVARDLTERLTRLFLPGEDGQRPCNAEDPRYGHDPHFREIALFYEYLDGDTCRGCGASHQTGWTARVAKFLRDLDR